METIEQLRRDFFIAHNELEQTQINVERLSAKLDEIASASSNGLDTTREVYCALAKATDAARQLLALLTERRRAAAYKLNAALIENGRVPAFTRDGVVF